MELARLETLTEEAALLCGQIHPGLVELRDEVSRLAMEMRAHLVFEEREVFPNILAQCKSGGAGLPPELLEPMKHILLNEHEAEAGHFRHIRRLVEDLPPFEDPRGLHPKLLAALRLLAEDLQHHIFLENQILFVRAF
jgi:iron-sulfur cluster repair protein YtfE (RIC family)